LELLLALEPRVCGSQLRLEPRRLTPLFVCRGMRHLHHLMRRSELALQLRAAPLQLCGRSGRVLA
jgi:hypothetical protein